MTKTFVALIALTVFITTSPALAGVKGGEITFSPFFGLYMFDGNQLKNPSVAIGGRLGYNLNSNWGVEGQYTHAQPNDGNAGNLNSLGGDLLYHLMSRDNFVPYVLLGGGWMITDNVPVVSKGATLDYGGGVKYYIDDSVSLRLDVRQIIAFDPNGNSSVAFLQNSEFTFGFSFHFGGARTAATSMEGIKTPNPPAIPEIASVPKLVKEGPAIWLAEKSEVPAGKITITGLKIDQNTLEILATERIRDYKIFTLTQPSRLIIDIGNVVNGLSVKSIPINRSGIAAVRFESFPDHLRISIDAADGRLIPYRVEETDNGLKIIITAP